MLRQFHVDWFVNPYVHESTSEDGKTLTFVTEALEDIPPGWRARETYILSGARGVAPLAPPWDRETLEGR